MIIISSCVYSALLDQAFLTFDLGTAKTFFWNANAPSGTGSHNSPVIYFGFTSDYHDWFDDTYGGILDRWPVSILYFRHVVDTKLRFDSIRKGKKEIIYRKLFVRVINLYKWPICIMHLYDQRIFKIWGNENRYDISQFIGTNCNLKTRSFYLWQLS